MKIRTNVRSLTHQTSVQTTVHVTISAVHSLMYKRVRSSYTFPLPTARLQRLCPFTCRPLPPAHPCASVRPPALSIVGLTTQPATRPCAPLSLSIMDLTVPARSASAPLSAAFCPQRAPALLRAAFAVPSAPLRLRPLPSAHTTRRYTKARQIRGVLAWLSHVQKGRPFCTQRASKRSSTCCSRSPCGARGRRDVSRG